MCDSFPKLTRQENKFIVACMALGSAAVLGNIEEMVKDCKVLRTFYDNLDISPKGNLWQFAQMLKKPG